MATTTAKPRLRTRIADFLTELLLKIVLFAAVLVLAPVAIDSYYYDVRVEQIHQIPEHLDSLGPAGDFTLPWLVYGELPR